MQSFSLNNRTHIVLQNSGLSDIVNSEYYGTLLVPLDLKLSDTVTHVISYISHQNSAISHVSYQYIHVITISDIVTTYLCMYSHINISQVANILHVYEPIHSACLPCIPVYSKY